VQKGDVYLGMFFFIMAEIGYRAGQVFYNSLLTEVAEPHEIVFRLERMALEPNNILLVADMDRIVVGLCQIQGVRLIANEGYAEINVLAVRASHQGRGIGKSLVDAAIGWAEERCYAKVRLWSQVDRLAAHCFYEAYGFSKSRTSHAFDFVLPSVWAERSDDLRTVGLPVGDTPRNQPGHTAIHLARPSGSVNR